MAPSQDSHFDFRSMPPRWSNWKQLLVIWGGSSLVVLILLVLTWNVFFKYVPPGMHLVVIAKNGDVLDPGEVLAKPGQKGILKDVLGEGWHFITPIVY